MNCPYCNHDETKVIDSRESKDGTCIKRRRECLKCEKRFSTTEKIMKLDLEVKKTSGEVEEFNIQKIRKGLLKACEKRPITLEQIDNLVEKILVDIKKVEDSVIPTSDVGKIVLKNLKDMDEIAFLKFAIVHNNYSSMGEFMQEIDNLKSFEGLDYKS
jgi:transcriptional repressor NrdR